jgi:hypothetical protein
MPKTLPSIIAIAVCASAGTYLAWLLVGTFGLGDLLSAILTVFLAMVLSTAAFAGMIAVGRALKLLK